VTQSAEPVDDRVWRDVAALAAIGAAALGFGLVLAWVLAGSLSRPQRALAQTARRLGAGDLDARAEETGPKEQREVARAFNGMADRLGRVLAAQREFVANASHQLRTPLTGLRLRLEAASYRATDPELERELAEAEREVDRLANLLGVLLTLAQEGGARPAPSPVSVSAAATAALYRWAQQAARDGRELVAAGAEDVWVAASEDDVATILDALVDNALRYSPAGGTVTIEWAPGELAVADEGPGLSPGEEEQVFERFRRGAAGAAGPKGTGLGLAIVRALAERWGGSVSMANRPERGARAVVRLPASPALPGEAPTEVLAR
jgi:signal transduction histidine kinase